LHLRLLRPDRADRLWPTATAVGKKAVSLMYSAPAGA
jgi:hypothetical protein